MRTPPPDIALTPEQAALTERHYRLACMEARRASIKIAGLTYDDALSDGLLGLLRAARIFDPDRGLAFSTIACPKIRGAIVDGMRERSRSRRLTLWLREHAAAEQRVMQRTGTTPTDAELAAELQLDVATYRARRAKWHVVESIVSDVLADEPVVEGGDITPLSRVAEPRATDANLLAAERTQLLLAQLVQLPPLEQHVLCAYYYEDMKLHVIAAELGITESRVSQVRSAALARLRTMIGDNPVLRDAA